MRYGHLGFVSSANSLLFRSEQAWELREKNFCTSGIVGYFKLFSMSEWTLCYFKPKA
jgi:hypothetical protein